MKFLLQTINNKIVHDFVFELERSLEYLKWKGETVIYKYCELENISRYINKDYIPIGTIEFVKTYNNGNLPPPINIPSCFIDKQSFTMLPVIEGDPKELNLKPERLYFVKDCNKIKSSLNGFYMSNDIKNINLKKIQVREKIPKIISEWRVFVYKGEILGCQFYSGDPLCFPDSTTINDFILPNYKNSPESYTLDIFVSNDLNGYLGTYIMEIHDFYSCGLYGFSDYSKLPYMFSRTWYKIVKPCKP